MTDRLTMVFDGLALARQMGALPSGDRIAAWMQRFAVRLSGLASLTLRKGESPNE